MQIRLGSAVMAEDGRAGTVDRIILHPETREIDALVATQGDGSTDLLVVPIDRVLAADGEAVRVSGTVEEIHGLDLFTHSQFVEPPEEWLPPTADAAGFYLMPASPVAVGAFQQPATMPDPPAEEVEDLEPGDFEIKWNTQVFCTDGLAGRLDRVLTDGDSDVVTHLVIMRDGGAGDVAVPLEQVASLGDEGVHLALTTSQIRELPAFDS